MNPIAPYSFSAISHLVGAIASLVPAWLIYKSYKKNPQEFTKYFALYFLMFGIGNLFLFLIEFIFPLDTLIQGIAALFSTPFFYLAMAFFFMIPASLKFPKLKNVGFAIIILLGFISFILGIIEPYSSSIDERGLIMYKTAKYVDILFPFMFILGWLPGIIVFITEAVKSKDRIIRKRSIVLSLGLISLFIFGQMHGQVKTWQGFLVADIFTALSYFVVMAGVLYRGKRIKSVQTKGIVGVIIILILITSNFYDARSEDSGAYAPAEIIIKTKSNDFGKLGALNQKFHVAEIEWLEKNTFRLKMENENENIERAVRKYSQNQEIALVEPNYVLRAVATPTDPLFNLQWGLHNTGQTVNGTAGKADIDVNAPEAWDVSTGTASTIVAVLDTGINANHEDLTGKIVTGYDFVNNDVNASDDNGHGTMIAGVVGAIPNNSKGIAGMNWNAKIMPVKVLGSDGSGTVSALIEGINYAVNNGAAIINMSLVGDYSSALDATVKNAYDRGVLLVSAAGNSATNLDTTPMSPISNDGDANWILGIGALDQLGNAASFSSYGSKYIDIAAPGTNILSTYLGDTAYVYALGTSISAGLVSGVASLVKDKETTLTGQVVKQRILNGAKNLGLGSMFGKGNIDAYGAIVARNSNIKKIGVMRKENDSDYNFYVYSTPTSMSPQTLTGSDLWNIPAGNNPVATTGVDIDGDGVKELAVMKNDGGDYNLYVYNSPQGSSPQLIRAMDLWNIPSGDNVIAIAGVDYNGDGRDELAIMKNENGDYNMYIYFAPTTTEATYLIGGDKWNIPSGDNVIAMTGADIDGDLKDEIAVMKNEGGDYNLYIYRAPNGMVPADLMGTDKWEIPSGNNTIGISGVDINGDGRDEIGIMKNEGGDYNLYIYQAPIGTGAMPVLAGDKWNIPSGNNVVGVATVE